MAEVRSLKLLDGFQWLNPPETKASKSLCRLCSCEGQTVFALSLRLVLKDMLIIRNEAKVKCRIISSTGHYVCGVPQ